MTESQILDLISPVLPKKVFRILAPADVREPYVVVSLVSAVPSNTLNGTADADRLVFRVDSYARTRRDAMEVMNQIVAIIDAREGDPLVNDRTELYEQDTRIHRVSITISTFADGN